MSKPTKNGIFQNVIWKFAERFMAQLVSMVVSIILARLLCPEDYGLISIVTIIITLCNVFVSSGFSTALIQKKEVDEIDYNSMMYSSLAISIVLYAIVYFASPLIGTLYNDMRLVTVIRVMALRLPLGAINAFQQAYLSRKMQYRKFFLATLFGTLISAGIGISMAYSGMGHWALVAQYLSNGLIGTLSLAITIRWRPRLLFSIKRTLELLSFGWKVLCTSLLDTLFQELRSILISLKYSTADLAFYTKGNSYPNLLTTNINVSLSNVMFSAMSKEQEHVETIKALMKKSIQVSTFFISPLLIGLAVVADDFVRILLTEKWLECVPYIQITCVYSLFYPLHTINLQALNAVGKSGRVLKLEIIKKVLNVGIIILTVQFGVLAIAYGALAISLISTYINAIYSKREFGYSFFAQLKDIAPTFGCALIMGAAVIGVNQILPWSGIGAMLLKILIGAIVYVAFAFLFRLNALKFALSKILRKKNVA
ncbi:MAG: lipopolysaccharide biosynthesis protein [Clostridia bacterium]|nr:lipopolysaccharide biosynthesis protein [Clostridia bacterium]